MPFHLHFLIYKYDGFFFFFYCCKIFSLVVYSLQTGNKLQSPPTSISSLLQTFINTFQLQVLCMESNKLSALQRICCSLQGLLITSGKYAWSTEVREVCLQKTRLQKPLVLNQELHALTLSTLFYYVSCSLA